MGRNEQARPSSIEPEAERRQVLKTEFSSLVRKVADRTKNHFSQYKEHRVRVGEYTFVFQKQTADTSYVKGEAFGIYSHDVYATFTLDETGISRGLVPNENKFSMPFFSKINRTLELPEMENLLAVIKSPHLNEDLIDDLITPADEENAAFEAERARDETTQKRLDKRLRELSDFWNPGFRGDYDPDDPDDPMNIRYSS